MIKKGIYVHLILAGLLTVMMAVQCFADAASEFEQAQTLDKNGYVAPAKVMYEQIIQNYPGTDEAFKAQAAVVLCLPAERPADIYAAIDKFLGDFPDNNLTPTAGEIIGSKLAERKQYNTAKYIFEQVLHNYPDKPEIKWVPLRIAEVNVLSLIESSSYESAVSAVEELITRFPDNAGSLYRIGERYEEHQQFEKAKALYQRMVTGGAADGGYDWPGLGIARVNILSLIQSGKYAEVQAAVDKLIADFSSHSGTPASLYSIAKSFEGQKRYDLAKSLYQRIMQLYEGSPPAGWAALDFKAMDVLTAIQSQDYSAAENEVAGFATAFSKQPGSEWVLYKAAKGYERSGEYQRAMSLFEAIKRDYPDFEFVKNYNANYYAGAFRAADLLKAGDVSSSKAEIDNMQACVVGNPEAAKGILMAAEGLYMSSYHGGIMPEPGNPFYLTIAAMLGDDLEESISGKIDAAAASDIYYTRALSYWNLGDYSSAADSFMEAIETYPNHQYAGAMHWLVANCYEKLKGAGDVNGVDADGIIEWAYQTLFDKYPNCRQVNLAALRLVEINLDKGKPATACAYYYWLLDNAHEDEGRVPEISRLIEGLKECQK